MSCSAVYYYMDFREVNKNIKNIRPPPSVPTFLLDWNWYYSYLLTFQNVV